MGYDFLSTYYLIDFHLPGTRLVRCGFDYNFTAFWFPFEIYILSFRDRNQLYFDFILRHMLYCM